MPVKPEIIENILAVVHQGPCYPSEMVRQLVREKGYSEVQVSWGLAQLLDADNAQMHLGADGRLELVKPARALQPA